LVVEDDRNSAFALEMLLKHEGVAATVATTGEQAIDLADTWRPQIVLLDIGLPGMNGYQVAEAIRATDWGPGILLVAITGWGADADRARARQVGFDEYWTKPLELWRLIALLARFRESSPFDPPQGDQHV
jgi:DNA-binding response OmpR family regulator